MNVIVTLHITKTDNHFGFNNSYVIKAETLINAVSEANAYVPFSINEQCLSNLEKEGLHKQELYVFSC
ncbi:hypothetical protein CIB95_08130 [Lottiidibacillus patelloidae]|uniref:Uncharacterized protein n=1 Tax=Lottiidibacillus patelloidae TaxID=2670334 RepID=A0A263BV20_9BACI|nr:hypothetical protein [Lottiidibacillus patelloidae]OZM57418.1 hypothetical protein CIB95_08130 [Lottiidibacillus patelloidae]